MSAKFIHVDRNTPMLLAVDIREWLPSDHIVHLIIESVESLDQCGWEQDFGKRQQAFGGE